MDRLAEGIFIVEPRTQTFVEANAALLGHSAPLPDVSALREATDRAETITDVIAAQPFAELDEAELELVVTSLLAALLPIG